MHEIRVFGDDDRADFGGVLPNRGIIRRVESQIKNMNGLMCLRRNPPRQGGWQLRIHEEVHVGCNTAWSICFAAYAKAALMSSGSR